MLKFLVFIWLLMAIDGNAKIPRHMYLESPAYIGGGGMFHNFNIVLGCLDLYDKYDYLAFTVDFRDQGLYYEAEHGLNWWNYYFQPIEYAPRKEQRHKLLVKYFKDEEKGEIGNAAHFYMTRVRAHELITKYIRVRYEILEEVEEFYHHHLRNAFVIGVHYRGTDKQLEAERVPYDDVIKVLQEYIKQASYKIFVATDEVSFLKRVEEAFPGKVYYSDAQRCDQAPIHYVSHQCFLKGKEALIDCLLLAKSDMMIRTNSNLSAVSAYFNPSVPVRTLNTLRESVYQGACSKGELNELNVRP